MKEPRQFKCFDDFDNDGWGNSILDELRYRSQPEDDEEDVDGIREANFWAEFDGEEVTVVNRGGNFASTNTETAQIWQNSENTRDDAEK